MLHCNAHVKLQARRRWDCTVAATARGRRRRRGTRARRRRRRFAAWRRRWSRALGGLLLLLLLSGSGLLIVLVVGDVVLVPTVCGVRISRAVVLGILGAVVGCTGRAWGSLADRTARGAGRLLAAVVVAAVSSTIAVTTVTTITATTVAATVAALRRIVLEVLVLLSHVGEQILAQLLRSLNLVWVGTTFNRLARSIGDKRGDNSRDVQEHGLVTFTLGAVLDETRATALDLDTTTCALLNVLHIGTALADDLGTQVESGDRFEVDGNAFLWPFALRNVSKSIRLQVQSGYHVRDQTHPAPPARVLGA